MAHNEKPSRKSGSIPASSLHFWVNETDAAMDLVERFHYSGRWPSNVQLVMTAHLAGGLFGNKGDAVAAVVYSIPGTRWSVPVWELSRLVRTDNRLPLSALVAASVRKLKRMDTPGVMVSFADWTQKHHGGVYQACGWHYTGLRGRRMDGVIVDGEFTPGRSANSRCGTQSPSRLKERGIEAEPHYDEGKHLYWLAWGEGIQTAEGLGLESLPYPKPRRAA
jgi:hypothetical protein